MENHLEVIDEFQKLQSQMSKLWLAIQKSSPNTDIQQNKWEKTNLHLEDIFRKWLPKNGVIAGIDAYVSRLKMFQTQFTDIAKTLETIGLKETINKINSNSFKHLTLGTVNDIRTAVRKYNKFLNTIKQGELKLALING